jgi:hypothetical protein
VAGGGQGSSADPIAATFGTAGDLHEWIRHCKIFAVIDMG